MTRQKAALFFSILFLILSCQQQESTCDLMNTKEFYSQDSTIKYQHIKIFDTKFNSSRYTDTTYVTVFALPEDKIGFRMKMKKHEWFYDSHQLVELNYQSKTKSTESIESIDEIALWDKNLLTMLEAVSDDSDLLKSKDNSPFKRYVTYTVSKSHVDSSVSVVNVFEYAIPIIGCDNIRHKETIIRGVDTLQIQNHLFQNIRFDDDESIADVEKQIASNTYEIIEENNDLPFGKEPIAVGDELTKRAFTDIENNTVQIVGGEKQYTLLVFSFIGCAPCEIALKQLKQDKLGLSKKVNLYYSSFQDGNVAVRKYLNDKKIFRNAFGKQSNMIDEFRLKVSPSFVLIDSEGKITKIIEGFDNTVLTTLNDMLKSKR